MTKLLTLSILLFNYIYNINSTDAPAIITIQPIPSITYIPTISPTISPTYVPTSSSLRIPTSIEDNKDEVQLEYLTLILIPIIIAVGVACITKPQIIKNWCNLVMCKKLEPQEDSD